MDVNFDDLNRIITLLVAVLSLAAHAGFPRVELTSQKSASARLSKTELKGFFRAVRS